MDLFAIFGMTRADGRWANSSVSAITFPDKRAEACAQDATSGVS